MINSIENICVTHAQTESKKLCIICFITWPMCTFLIRQIDKFFFEDGLSKSDAIIIIKELLIYDLLLLKQRNILHRLKK